MAIVLRLRNVLSSKVQPRHCTSITLLAVRKNCTFNLARASFFTMKNGEHKDESKVNCSAGISTTSIAKIHHNFTLTQEVQEVERKWKKQFLNTTLFGEAVFVLGAMGVGKTTVIENEFRCHPVYSKYAYVDTDEIMGMLQGFAYDKVEEFYPIAREIAIRLTDWILDQKISFIAEGTCVKYLELIDYLQRLKTGGYVIRIKRLTHVPLDIVLERAKHRKNRLVPEHVVKSIYYGSKEGLNGLYSFNKDNRLFEDVDVPNENGQLNLTGKAFTT